MLAAMLKVLDEGTEMNKNQVRLTTGLGGQHLNRIVDENVERGFLEWTGPITRPGQSENYGQNLKSTERGNAWLNLWKLMKRVEDPTSRIRVTIQNREKKA